MRLLATQRRQINRITSSMEIFGLDSRAQFQQSPPEITAQLTPESAFQLSGSLILATGCILAVSGKQRPDGCRTKISLRRRGESEARRGEANRLTGSTSLSATKIHQLPFSKPTSPLLTTRRLLMRSSSMFLLCSQLTAGRVQRRARPESKRHVLDSYSTRCCSSGMY